MISCASYRFSGVVHSVRNVRAYAVRAPWQEQMHVLYYAKVGGDPILVCERTTGVIGFGFFFGGGGEGLALLLKIFTLCKVHVGRTRVSVIATQTEARIHFCTVERQGLVVAAVAVSAAVADLAAVAKDTRSDKSAAHVHHIARWVGNIRRLRFCHLRIHHRVLRRDRPPAAAAAASYTAAATASFAAAAVAVDAVNQDATKKKRRNHRVSLRTNISNTPPYRRPRSLSSSHEGPARLNRRASLAA